MEWNEFLPGSSLSHLGLRSRKQQPFHIFLVLGLWQLRKSWNSCLAQLHLRGRGWTNFSPLFNDWDDAGPPPTITSSYLESLGTSICGNCYTIVKKYWAAWGFLFWKRSVSPSSPGVFLWCFGFVFGWVCFVLFWKTPGFLLSPILQYVGIANQRQNVLMTVRASSVHGMSSKKNSNITDINFSCHSNIALWSECFSMER